LVSVVTEFGNAGVDPKKSRPVGINKMQIIASSSKVSSLLYSDHAEMVGGF
jgi:hypothetical protein